MYSALSTSRRALRAAAGALATGACRSLVGIGVASVVVALSGCYSSIPTTMTAVPQSAMVEAQISDAGRIALAERAGPEVSKVSGTVRSRSDTAITILVSEVSYLNGESNRWQGQELVLRGQDVKLLKQNSLSRKRTLLLAIAAGAAAVLAISQTSLKGIFTGGGQDKNPEPKPES